VPSPARRPARNPPRKLPPHRSAGRSRRRRNPRPLTPPVAYAPARQDQDHANEDAHGRTGRDPNTGKSTLFNALFGSAPAGRELFRRNGRDEEGQFAAGELDIDLIDLPGTTASPPAARTRWWRSICCWVGVPRNRGPTKSFRSSIDQPGSAPLPHESALRPGRTRRRRVNMIDAAKAQASPWIATALNKARVPVVRSRRTRLSGWTRSRRRSSPRPNRTRPRPARVPGGVRSRGVRSARRIGDVPAFLTRRLLLDVGGYVEQCWWVFTATT